MLLLSVLLIADRRQKSRLARLARQDDLTALPNRRRMQELASEAFATAHKHGEPLTVALIDLDHFKQIDDKQIDDRFG